MLVKNRIYLSKIARNGCSTLKHGDFANEHSALIGDIESDVFYPLDMIHEFVERASNIENVVMDDDFYPPYELE